MNSADINLTVAEIIAVVHTIGSWIKEALKMEQPQASLFGAGAIAFASLAGSWLNGWRLSRVERQKAIQVRQDTLEKEIRTALAEAAQNISGVLLAIAWVTWRARNEPQNLSESEISEYEATVKPLFPRAEAARVLLAALSPKAHAEISRLLNDLYDFDIRIGHACIKYKQSKPEGAEELGAQYGNCLIFQRMLVQAVTQSGIAGITSPKKRGERIERIYKFCLLKINRKQKSAPLIAPAPSPQTHESSD